MSRYIDDGIAIEYVKDILNVHRYYHPRSTTENFPISEVIEKINEVPTVDAVPVVRCKDCKYYELDSWAKVNGIPLIVAHNICKRWGEGCKTDENGFCFMGEKVTE